MLDWLQEHTVVTSITAGVSIAMFVGGLIALPLLVRRIPADYFSHEHRPVSRFAQSHWALRITMLVLKNALAVVLLVTGVAMLVLPGQGLLTILVGFLLMDIPGKYRVEKWLVHRRIISRPINWLRKRGGIEPLTQPHTHQSPHAPPSPTGGTGRSRRS